MSVIRLFHVVAVAALVVGCTQPEPAPPQITGQPIFDKFGGVIGCEGGEYIPGAPIDQQCLPPSDECEDQTFGTAAAVPCPPPREDREPDPTPNRPGTAAG